MNLTTAHATQGSGLLMASDKAEVCSYGKMEASMKGIGSTIRPMASVG
jgi:hypothetical protein